MPVDNSYKFLFPGYKPPTITPSAGADYRPSRTRRNVRPQAPSAPAPAPARRGSGARLSTDARSLQYGGQKFGDLGRLPKGPHQVTGSHESRGIAVPAAWNPLGAAGGASFQFAAESGYTRIITEVNAFQSFAHRNFVRRLWFELKRQTPKLTGLAAAGWAPVELGQESSIVEPDYRDSVRKAEVAKQETQGKAALTKVQKKGGHQYNYTPKQIRQAPPVALINKVYYVSYLNKHTHHAGFIQRALSITATRVNKDLVRLGVFYATEQAAYGVTSNKTGKYIKGTGKGGKIGLVNKAIFTEGFTKARFDALHKNY